MIPVSARIGNPTINAWNTACSLPRACKFWVQTSFVGGRIYSLSLLRCPSCCYVSAVLKVRVKSRPGHVMTICRSACYCTDASRAAVWFRMVMSCRSWTRWRAPGGEWRMSAVWSKRALQQFSLGGAPTARMAPRCLSTSFPSSPLSAASSSAMTPGWYPGPCFCSRKRWTLARFGRNCWSPALWARRLSQL